MGFLSYVKELKENDEWYTHPSTVKVILPYLKQFKTIWCPFDTKGSYFVRVFNENGYKVIYTHIKTGIDFFSYEPVDYDVIVSNPPWSLKDNIYKRLFELKKPWAMLMGANGIFDSKARYELFKKNGIEILVPKGRSKFIGRKDGQLISPPFQAVFVCHNILPSKIEYQK